MNDDAIDVLHDLAVDRCVRRADLLAAGVSRGVVARLLRRRIVTRVFRGVYVVGPPRLSHREFLRACLLYGGTGAVLSHRTGLELRQLCAVRDGRATMTTRRRHLRATVRCLVPVEGRRSGLLRVVQSTPTLPLPSETVDGFATTLVPRTLVDAAHHLGERPMWWAWREAIYRAVIDLRALERQLCRHKRRGQAAVRRLLARRRPVTRPGDDLRSRTGELTFLELIDGTALPRPQINAPLGIPGHGWLGDFVFDVGLVVETDGPDHETPEQRAEDEGRDREVRAAGFRVLRIPNDAMAHDPAKVLDDVLREYEIAQQVDVRRRAARSAAAARQDPRLRRAA